LSAARRIVRPIALAAAAASLAACTSAGHQQIDTSADPTAVAEGTVAAPAGSDASGGIPIGANGVVGEDLNEDALRVDVYTDFMCPACLYFEGINLEDLVTLEADGTIQLYVHPVAILDGKSKGTRYSTRTASAAATVADAAPEYYMPFSIALWNNQPEENTEGLTDEEIAQLAIDAGVPQDVVGTFADGLYVDWVAFATDRASIDGLGGTPTVMVDGEILSQADVGYFEEGVLSDYLTGLA